jgi:hypothetical protein
MKASEKVRIPLLVALAPCWDWRSWTRHWPAAHRPADRGSPDRHATALIADLAGGERAGRSWRTVAVAASTASL